MRFIIEHEITTQTYNRGRLVLSGVSAKIVDYIELEGVALNDGQRKDDECIEDKI